MAIYLTFLQHILASLKENGKAAVVVPNGFLTFNSGIQKKIRKEIVDNNWLRGVVSMPSNIFATTGTSVSIIFIDKSRNDEDEILLIDATKMGKKLVWKMVKELFCRQKMSNILLIHLTIKY